MTEEYLTIQTCAKKYNLNPITLRRWIKKGYIYATLEDNQYLIDEASLIEYLNTKRVGDLSISNNLSVQIARLEKENEMASRLIEQLQKENEFLRSQVQQLTNAINILTTKALESPEPVSLKQKIRKFFGLK